MFGRVSRCTISGNHFLRDDTITPVPCPTGPQMQPITPQVGVTMGNSSSDVLITGNVFRGMMQMAVCVNSSGALLIQTLSAHISLRTTLLVFHPAPLLVALNRSVLNPVRCAEQARSTAARAC